MTEQQEKEFDKLLSILVLLNVITEDYLNEFEESLKSFNKQAANILKNDFRTSHRNYEFLMAKIRPLITNYNLLDDFENLKGIIHEFLTN